MPASSSPYVLYVIYFDTNFESYSQLSRIRPILTLSCMLSTSIQILKAIHNNMTLTLSPLRVVCYLLRYKFWKLFTTPRVCYPRSSWLYVIYFDTNFVANLIEIMSKIISDCKITKKYGKKQIYLKNISKVHRFL